MSKRTSNAGANQGIQANTVTAEVLAVGPGAHAQKTALVRGNDHELLDVLAELRGRIEALRLPSPSQQKVEADVAALEQAAKTADRPEPARNRVAALIGTLTTVGVAVAEIAKLIEPVKKVLGL